MQPADFLDALKTAADTAAEAEAEFRRTVSARIAALEQARSFAFRRLNLMRAVAEAVAGADSEASALGAARAVLLGRLGWSGESQAQAEVLERFDAVARAVHGHCAPAAEAEGEEERPGPPEIAQTLADFEAWYAGTRGTPFWLLFETVMPETPLVDF